MNLRINITPTRRVLIFGVDRRHLDDLIWCASTFSINRLFWIDGYLLCVEVCEKALEHEINKKEFPISQVCYTRFPKYCKYYEVEKGVHMPIVNMTGTHLYGNILKAILTRKNEDET